MDNKLFSQWCDAATEKIKYRPDRLAVRQELLAHLEDRQTAFLAQGISADAAERKALEAMGSAEDIAPQLAALHKPWLGYIFVCTRASAVIAALLALFCCVIAGGSLPHSILGANHFDAIPANYGTLDYFSYPKSSDSSDGRYYQITEAGYSKAKSEFYCELRVLYWPQLRNFSCLAEFWAVDSLGNYYTSNQEAGYDDIPHVSVGGYSTSQCIAHCNMRITHFDCNAKWVELHYDRDGRDIVLHIDLTGGGDNGTA